MTESRAQELKPETVEKFLDDIKRKLEKQTTASWRKLSLEGLQYVALVLESSQTITTLDLSQVFSGKEYTDPVVQVKAYKTLASILKKNSFIKNVVLDEEPRCSEAATILQTIRSHHKVQIYMRTLDWSEGIPTKAEELVQAEPYLNKLILTGYAISSDEISRLITLLSKSSIRKIEMETCDFEKVADLNRMIRALDERGNVDYLDVRCSITFDQYHEPATRELAHWYHKFPLRCDDFLRVHLRSLLVGNLETEANDIVCQTKLPDVNKSASPRALTSRSRYGKFSSPVETKAGNQLKLPVINAKRSTC